MLFRDTEYRAVIVAMTLAQGGVTSENVAKRATVTQACLARHFDVTDVEVGRTIKRGVEEGWLARSEDTLDHASDLRTGSFVWVTSAGNKKAAEMFRAFKRMITHKPRRWVGGDMEHVWPPKLLVMGGAYDDDPFDSHDA